MRGKVLSPGYGPVPAWGGGWTEGAINSTGPVYLEKDWVVLSEASPAATACLPGRPPAALAHGFGFAPSAVLMGTPVRVPPWAAVLPYLPIQEQTADTIQCLLIKGKN